MCIPTSQNFPPRTRGTGTKRLGRKECPAHFSWKGPTSRLQIDCIRQSLPYSFIMLQTTATPWSSISLNTLFNLKRRNQHLQSGDRSTIAAENPSKQQGKQHGARSLSLPVLQFGSSNPLPHAPCPGPRCHCEDETTVPITFGTLACNCVILCGPVAPACGSPSLPPAPCLQNLNR